MSTVSVKRQQPLGKKVITERLRDMAYARGPGAKLPTRRELCGVLGTSAATIDDVLNELEALRIITRRQGSGIFVSPTLNRKQIAITLFCDYVEQVEASPFWSHLWQMLSKKALSRAENSEQDFTFHLISRTDALKPPGSLARLIETKQILGVIGIGLSIPSSEWIKEQGVPVVAFAGAGHYHVKFDTDQIVDFAVPRLVEQGCRRIGLIGPTRDDNNAEEFTQLSARFLRQVQCAGLDCGDLYVYGEHTEGSLQERGFQAAMALLAYSTAPPPDGLIIMNDMVTSGTLVALHKLGLQLGHDVRIATHVNVGSPILFGYKDDMILLEVDAAKIVDKLFETLDLVLAGEAHEMPPLIEMPLQPRNGGERI